MPDTPLSLVVVGDVIPARPLFPNGQPATTEFGEVVELFEAADLAIGNLDSALTTGGTPIEKLINVRTDPSAAADLGRLGFDVISVANNHANDYGAQGLFDTMQALRDAGIQPVGGGANLAEANAPAIVEANGWKVGVLAWTCLLPTGGAAGPERPGMSPLHVHVSYEVNPYLIMEEATSPPLVRSRVDEAELEAAKAEIAKLQAEVDFVVVLVHWGQGVSDSLDEYQRPLGRALLDAGADIVVGSHPHRVLGIERHGDKAIFYSGGTLIEQLDRNLVTPDLRWIFNLLSPDSFVATLDVQPDRSYAIRITPTTIVSEEDGAGQLARGEDFDRIAERLVSFSKALDTEVEVRGGEVVLELGAQVTV
jgi:poly-gamma-glutamate capsule biosynthesis protein CapA/YwtB (metallophosphatase superfamily)